MPRRSWFWGIAFGATVALMSSPALAGHHSYGSYGSSGSNGSSGGSYGSSGSNGGSYGSYGSSGGSSHHHHRHHRHSHGSSGSSGGSGGGSGGGSYGSGGSSGGSYGSYASGGGYVMGANAAAPVFAAGDTHGHLALTVPTDAIVYLGDQQMATRGSTRNYSIPGLEAGRTYRYPIRVEVVRAGTVYRGTAEPQVQAGQRVELAFQQFSGQTQAVASRN